MTQVHMSQTTVGIVLVVVAAGFYGLVKLYGARMDGERQKVRDKVKAREEGDE